MDNKVYYNLVNKFFDDIEVFDYVRIDSINYEYYWDDEKQKVDYDIYIEGQAGWNSFDENGREIVDAYEDFNIVVYDKKLSKRKFLEELSKSFIKDRCESDVDDVDCKVLFVTKLEVTKDETKKKRV